MTDIESFNTLLKKSKDHFEKIRIKSKGDIWQINNNDHHPSHAHNVNTGAKLNLETGIITDKSKNTQIQMPLKKLEALKEEAKRRGTNV